MRTRAERRHNDWTEAIRKKNIAIDVQDIEWYNNLHQYSKNKIHCSCPLCRAKVGKPPLWGTCQRRRKNYTLRDLKRYDEMLSELRENDEIS